MLRKPRRELAATRDLGLQVNRYTSLMVLDNAGGLNMSCRFTMLRRTLLFRHAERI